MSPLTHSSTAQTEAEETRSSDVSGERPADGQTSGAPSPRRLIALAALLLYVALVSIAARLMELPISRAVELRYCQKYYLAHDPSQIGRDGNIAEDICKVDEVQRGLGWMLGALGTLTTFCGTVFHLHHAGSLSANSHRYSRHSADGRRG